MMIQIVLSKYSCRVYYDFLLKSVEVSHMGKMTSAQRYSLDQTKNLLNEFNCCLKDYIKCFYKKD